MWPSLLSWVGSFAPSPPSSSPPSPALPTLPPELILNIIRSSLPPTLAYDTFLERSASLRSYALVSRAWRPLAQAELFRDVVVPDGTAANLLLSMLQGEPDLAQIARTIRLGGGKRPELLEMGPMARVLRRCTRTEELWMAGTSGWDLEWFRGCSNLKRLYVSEARLVASSHVPLVLPSLTHLYLKAVILAGPTSSNFLSPASLPSLASLDFLSLHLSSLRSSSLLIPFASQLTSLSVGDYHGRSTTFAELSNFTSLTTLDLPYSALFPADARTPLDASASLTSHIPPSVTSLRIRGSPLDAASDFAADVLGQLVGREPTLRVVALLSQELLEASNAEGLFKGNDVVVVPEDYWSEEGARSKVFRGEFDAFRRGAGQAAAFRRGGAK